MPFVVYSSYRVQKNKQETKKPQRITLRSLSTEPRSRTGTPLRAMDFESIASAYSASPACFIAVVPTSSTRLILYLNFDFSQGGNFKKAPFICSCLKFVEKLRSFIVAALLRHIVCGVATQE